ncbi:phage protein NinX family protein [Pseudomonas guariconensis]
MFCKKRGQALQWDVLYNPHEDWALGGLLIEKNMVSLHCPQSTDDVWAAWVITDKGEFCQPGDTALVAACRAIVSAKLGDTVQVPKELMP